MNVHVHSARQKLLLDLDSVDLPAVLTLPAGALGLALFAGDARAAGADRRQRHVARILERAGVGTLICDLADGTEGDALAAPCDADVLARRLLAVARWAAAEAGPASLPLGYFGAGSGAAAAFMAAAAEPQLVAAVVASGAGPDLLGPWLSGVRAPTLFMVGAADRAGLNVAGAAAERLHGPRRLALVTGAGRQFDQPGTLDVAAHMAGAWFVQYFAMASPPRRARLRWHHLMPRA